MARVQVSLMVSAQTSLKLESLAPTTAGRTGAPSKGLLVTGNRCLRLLKLHEGGLRVLPAPSILLAWSVCSRIPIPLWEVPLKGRRSLLLGSPV